MRRRSWIVGVLVLIAAVAPVSSQSLSQQVLQLLSRVNTWTGQQTFSNFRLTSALPAVTTNRLYNVSGDLYWNGVAVVVEDSPVNLTLGVIGNLPVANLNSGTGADATTFWRGDGVWAVPGGGGGTVTSVAMTLPSFLSVSGSPITGGGTLAVSLATQAANLVFAGPGSGADAAPTFRSLVALDIPTINVLTQTTGTVSVARGGTGLTAGTSGGVLYYSASGTLASSGALTADRLVIGGGAGVAPTVLTDGTANQVLHGGGGSTPTWGAVNLASQVTGNLPVTNLNSGTGATSGTFWRGDGTWAAPGVGGTVTSVAASVPSFLSVAGSPITSSGTLALTLAEQSPNAVFAGPNSGATPGVPTFRALVNADLPLSGASAGTYTKLTVNTRGVVTTGATASLATDFTGTLPVGNGGTGLTTAGADSLLVSTGAAFVARTLPDCTSGLLGYATATDLFSCPANLTLASGYIQATRNVADGTVLDLTNNSATGHGISVIAGAATRYSLNIGNYNGTVLAFRVMGDGATTVGGTLATTGAATFSSTLAVNGVTTLAGLIGTTTRFATYAVVGSTVPTGLSGSGNLIAGGAAGIQYGHKMPIDFATLNSATTGGQPTTYISRLVVATYDNDPADLRIQGDVVYNGTAVTTGNRFGSIPGKIHFDALTGCENPGVSCVDGVFRETALIQGKISENFWDGTAISGTPVGLYPTAMSHPGTILFMTYNMWQEESTTVAALTHDANFYIGGGGWGSDGLSLSASASSVANDGDCWDATDTSTPGDGTYPLHEVLGAYGRCNSTIFVRGGGLRLRALITPTAPTVTTIGTGGATTYVYSVIAIDAAGNITGKSAETTITNGPATLSATNANVISWPRVSGASAYYIIKGAGADDALYSNNSLGKRCTPDSTYAVSSLTRVGTTATMVAGVTHVGLRVGDDFTISGATDVDTLPVSWNGNYVVASKPGDGTITFSVAGTNAATATTPATGTILYAFNSGECYFGGTGPVGDSQQYIKADGSRKYFLDTGYSVNPNTLPTRNTTADLRIDGAIAYKGVAYANLGSGQDIRLGMLVYCLDCTKATPCASGGAGALAVYRNSGAPAWDCNP